MKIVNAPSSVLASKTQPVTIIDDRIKKLVNEMIVTLESQTDPEGVGLAANQVGLPLSLFIIKPDKKLPCQVLINPEIISTIKQSPTKTKPKKPSTKLEGCLSIPRIWGKVKRINKIQVKYQTLDGTTHTEWFEGFTAVIIQHEMDHLNGVLFTQRVLEQSGQLYREEKDELVKCKL